MKAIHKYKEAAKRGNKEAQRRISQSMGYRFSIWDMPDMIKLLKRADITFDDSPEVLDYRHMPDAKTIQL